MLELGAAFFCTCMVGIAVWRRRVRIQQEQDARDRARMMAAIRWQPVNPDVPRLVAPRRVTTGAAA